VYMRKVIRVSIEEVSEYNLGSRAWDFDEDLTEAWMKPYHAPEIGT
jgi:hypothetical protein